MELKIEPVSAKNRKSVLALTAAPGQEGFVETPAACLREARRLRLWRPVAILAEQTVIGFAMYGFFPREGAHGRVWLDRLLIGGGQQGKGYGMAAIGLLIDRLRREYGCGEVFLSCYPQNTAAMRLYQKLGFAPNGEKDINGEDVLVLTLAETGNSGKPGGIS